MFKQLMDGQYQERDYGRLEAVIKDGGNGRHTPVYKTQGEKVNL